MSIPILIQQAWHFLDSRLISHPMASADTGLSFSDGFVLSDSSDSLWIVWLRYLHISVAT